MSFETAYLKAHYPVEFMTSLLNVSGTDIERINFLVGETKKMGINVLPPDINQSFQGFTVDTSTGSAQVTSTNSVRGGNIRFGLLAIKNVGGNIVDVIINERSHGGPFADLSNFLTRIQNRDLNKKSLESLIKAGAFDSFGTDRGQLLENLEDMVKFNQAARKSATSNQDSLFGGTATFTSLRLRPSAPVAKNVMLSWEKDLLGLYLTDHPLNGHNGNIGARTKNIGYALALPKNGERSLKFSIAGVIAAEKKIITKKGQPMLFVTLEDKDNSIEALVFNGVLEKNLDVWAEGAAVVVDGFVSWKNGETKFIVDSVKVL